MATRCIWPPESFVTRCSELVGDAQQRRDLVHLLADAGSGRRPRRRAQRKSQIVEHGQMRIERILLEHEGDVALRRRGARDIRPAMRICARVRPLEARDQAQSRRLAGAGRPEQHDECAVVDREATGRSTALRRAKALRYADRARPQPWASSIAGACSWSAVQDGATGRSVEQRNAVRPEFKPYAIADRHLEIGGHASFRAGRAAVVTVTICVVPRYSVPKTSPRNARSSFRRTCSGRTPRIRSRADRRLARRGNGDLGVAEPDPGAARLKRVVEGQKVHRRRADEIRDEDATQAGRRSPAARPAVRSRRDS